MTTIVVFGLSLFVASVLIIVKSIELHRGNKNFLLRLLGKLENKSEHFVSSAKFRGLQFIQSIRYILFVESKIYTKNLIEQTKQKVLDEYKKREGEIMGRKEISNKGAVSFYLKKITEEKGSGKNGRIEEELV